MVIHSKASATKMHGIHSKILDFWSMVIPDALLPLLKLLVWEKKDLSFVVF